MTGRVRLSALGRRLGGVAHRRRPSRSVIRISGRSREQRGDVRRRARRRGSRCRTTGHACRRRRRIARARPRRRRPRHPGRCPSSLAANGWTFAAGDVERRRAGRRAPASRCGRRRRAGTKRSSLHQKCTRDQSIAVAPRVRRRRPRAPRNPSMPPVSDDVRELAGSSSMSTIFGDEARGDATRREPPCRADRAPVVRRSCNSAHASRCVRGSSEQLASPR